MKQQRDANGMIVEYGNHKDPSDQDFDGDPKAGLPDRNQDLLAHGHGTHQCNFCKEAPISALSDYGWFCWGCYGEPNDEDLRLKDFCHDDDTDEPDWVGCCWVCWRAIVEGEQ